jgi:hypothetical protein
MVPVYKYKSPVLSIKHGVFIHDEEPEVDEDLTEGFPKMVKWGTKLL